MARPATRIKDGRPRGPSMYYNRVKNPERFVRRAAWRLRSEVRRGWWGKQGNAQIGAKVAICHLFHLARSERPCLFCGMYLNEDFSWRPLQE